MQFRIRIYALATAAALAAFAPLASAGSVVYLSQAAWQSSNPGNSTVFDFESLNPAYYSTIVLNPLTFSTTGSLLVLNGAASGTGSGHYLTTDTSASVTISIASGVYGLAFNLGDNQAPTELASITAVDLNGVQYTTSNFATAGSANPAAFWGLRNDVQLTSVKITFSSGVQPQLDNVRYTNLVLTSGSPSPEAATIWMAIAGLGCLAVRKARRPTWRSGGSSRPDG